MLNLFRQSLQLSLAVLYSDNCIIADRKGLIIRIDSPIVCWLSAPFKKLSCIIAELFYCPSTSRSVPGSINRGCSARHFHLVNSTPSRRNRQMRVRDSDRRIYTDELENVGPCRGWSVVVPVMDELGLHCAEAESHFDRYAKKRQIEKRDKSLQTDGPCTSFRRPTDSRLRSLSLACDASNA